MEKYDEQTLSDVFTYLNCLHLSAQGRTVTLLKLEDKAEAMNMKLHLWSERLKKSVFESFPNSVTFFLQRPNLNLKSGERNTNDLIKQVL
jgi:hypothetical protein